MSALLSRRRWLLMLIFSGPLLCDRQSHRCHSTGAAVANETDTNYSNIFSIWNRIFGTCTPTIDFCALRHGLPGFDDHEKQTDTALLKLPYSINA
jgi:hypothetical protein